MKRKSLRFAGITLAVYHSIAVMFSIALAFACMVLVFTIESIESPVVNDLLLPILEPIWALGKTLFIFIAIFSVIWSILLLVGSTRVIRYSSETVENFAKKKGRLIFFTVCFFLTLAVLIYNLIVTFSIGNLIFTILYLIPLIFLLVGLISNTGYIETKSEVQTVVEQQESIRPAIYTAGLDEEKQEIVSSENETQKEAKRVEKVESKTSQKLVESIGKLDQMRKEGTISTPEYTKLRSQMIKKYVNNMKQ